MNSKPVDGRENSTSMFGDHPYKVKKIPIDDPEYKSETPEYLQNKDIPGFPTTVLCVGGPGSGKSNVFINFLLYHWKGFFDKIYLFGPTCKSDKIYKNIQLPDDQITTKEHEFIPKLQQEVDKQIDAVEHNHKQADKVLFGFEDITSYYDKAQRHPAFGRCFNAIRHHKATAWANVHKYKAMNRTARNCCKHILVWPIVDSDLEQIAEDYSIPGVNKKAFMALAWHAWTPDEENKKPFFYINTYADRQDRFRRNFTDIIGYNAPLTAIGTNHNPSGEHAGPSSSDVGNSNRGKKRRGGGSGRGSTATRGRQRKRKRELGGDSGRKTFTLRIKRSKRNTTSTTPELTADYATPRSSAKS